MSLYNFDFDIASIILYVAIFLAYIPRKHLDRRQHIVFRLLYSFGLLVPILEISSILLIQNFAPLIFVHLCLILFFYVKAGSVYFLLIYVLSTQSRNTNPIKRSILTAIPVFIFSAIILTSPFTGFVYSYKNIGGINLFSDGPGKILSYILAIIYYSMIIIYVFNLKKSYNKFLRVMTYVICLLNISLAIIQYFFGDLLVDTFIFSISILLLVVNIEKYTNVLDSVTGLANRDYFEEICQKNFQNGKEFAVVLISIPNYDNLVQNYGVKNMVKVFTEIGKNVVSRAELGRAFELSNNCFAVLKKYDEDLTTICEHIYKQISKPWPLDNMEIPIDALVSILKCPDNAEDMDALISIIQTFKAYNSKIGLIDINEMDVENVIYERQMEFIIREGLKHNRYTIHYQPICMAHNQNFVTAEALLRLEDPDLGNIPPDEFIPVAEKTGAIIEIGNFVLETVCEFIKTHDMEKLGLHYIEVNLSTIQCLQPNFIENLTQITDKYGIDPKYLCFEITETGTTDAPKILNDNLDTLSNMGYLLALDDFGTGFSSVKRMVSSNYGIIKFDKQLTQQFSENDNLQKVYTKLLTVFQTMGSKVVSEGIETKEQFEFVRDAGCGYIQGFFFSKPLPEKLFCEFLESRKKE